MVFRRWSSGFLLSLILWVVARPGWAAPLFPDVPDQHWARDAVAALAAKGLVEGYPDGTFKGDRVASRWELAMVVARLLARMEQEHATFATKAELQELAKLAAALREELDALGVRVVNLEESVARLDQRVTEEERLTFGGEIHSIWGAQNFHNTGSPAMLSAPTGVPVANYAALVGTVSGAGSPLAPPDLAAGTFFEPSFFGVQTVTDWEKGIPLTDGSMFCTLAISSGKAACSPSSPGRWPERAARARTWWTSTTSSGTSRWPTTCATT